MHLRRIHLRHSCWRAWLGGWLWLAATACQGDFHGNGWVTPATDMKDTSTGGAEGADDPPDEPQQDPEQPDQEPEAPAEPADPGDEPEVTAPPPDPVFGGDPVCTRGQMSAEEDDEGSELMAPGRACIGCHEREDDAPVFALAGTVYATGHEPSSVRFPIRARVLFEGRTRTMMGEVTTGDCNGCHTQSGANGAPGRIALP